MIYQHRLVIARAGRLVERNTVFERETLSALEASSSVLIGAWEIWIGGEAGCGVFQLRQFESLAAWETHQEALRRNRAFTGQRNAHLFPALDFVTTSIVRLADRSPVLPETWPTVEEAKGTARGIYEQRTLYFRPDSAEAHHELYFSAVAPALEREGGKLIAFFDTLIGPGTTNAGSHRSIELRRFPDLASWQRWRETQESEPSLAQLTKQKWLAKVDRVESALLWPLDYSRMR